MQVGISGRGNVKVMRSFIGTTCRTFTFVVGQLTCFPLRRTQCMEGAWSRNFARARCFDDVLREQHATLGSSRDSAVIRVPVLHMCVCNVWTCTGIPDMVMDGVCARSEISRRHISISH